MPEIDLKRGKVLALDYGRSRIGVASGNIEVGIAVPRGHIVNKSREFVFDELEDLVEELSPVLFVMGLALNMDNSSSEIAREIEKFANELKEKFGLEVVLVDERLSSFEAEKVVRTVDGGARYLKDKGLVDALAAQEILQRFFDSLGAN